MIDGTRWAVLVNPGFGVETKWAYQQLSASRGAVRPLSQEHMELDRESVLSWTKLADAAENDFEAPVFARYSLLREIKQTLLAQGAKFALLSGSGSTVFGMFLDEGSAIRAKAAFANQKFPHAFVVPTCSAPLAVRQAAESPHSG